MSNDVQPSRGSRLRRALMTGTRHHDTSYDDQWSRAWEEKRLRALASWALRQMGEKHRAYIVTGEKQFWFNFILLLSHNNYDWLAALEQVPLAYPDRVRRKSKKFETHLFLKEHEKHLPLVARNKKKNWSKSNYQREDLAEKLPGATKEELDEYVAEPKAAVVVYKYLCRRYKVEFGWENLKKLIGQARKEKKLLGKIIESANKQNRDYKRLVHQIQRLK